MKKLASLSLLSASLSFTSFILSSSLHAETSFYAGLQGGYSHASASVTHEHNLTSVAGMDHYKLTPKLKRGGFQGGLIGGADFITSSKIILGAQLFADFDANKPSELLKYEDIPEGIKLTFSRKFVITPALKIAYPFTPALQGFLSLGLALSSFKTNLNNSEDSITKDKTAFKPGFSANLGIDYRLSPNISLLGIVGFETYGSIKTEMTGVFARADIAALSSTTSIKPRYITGKLGAIWRFN